MKRIGIAASIIAKNNPVLYNFYVVLISFLFSLFIFVVAGSTVVFALVVISYLGNEILPLEMKKDWSFVLSLCMVSLTMVVVIFNVLAISVNIKLPWSKK